MVKATLFDGSSIALLEAQLAECLNPTEPPVLENLRVALDGSGDYLTVRDMSFAESGGTEGDLLKVEVLPGLYPESDFFLPQYIDLCGIGPKGSICLEAEQPDEVTPISLTASVETLWFNGTGSMDNIKVTAKNMRYAVHSDSGLSIENACQEVNCCEFIHYGNEGALTAYVAIGGNAATVWGGTSAWGGGSHSGYKLTVRDSTMISPRAAFSIHSNADFTVPAKVVLKDSYFEGTDPARCEAVEVVSLGSGQVDTVDIINCELVGSLRYRDYAWLAQDAVTRKQGNHNETLVTITGDPVAVSSATTAVNFVFRLDESEDYPLAISGAAAADLFGTPVVRIGSNGLETTIVAEENYGPTSTGGCSLSVRLGDLSALSKTLILTAKAGPVTILLDLDYSTMTEAAILADINSKLPEGFGAFSIEQYWLDRNLPIVQTLHDTNAQNVGSVAILKGQPTAFVTGGIELMDNTHPAADFAGIALDDINVNATGNVSKRDFYASSFANSITGTLGATAEVIGTSEIRLGGNRIIAECINENKNIWRFVV